MCWYEIMICFFNNVIIFTADPVWDEELYEKKGYGYGYCVDIANKDQEEGTYKVGKKTTPQSCIDLCRGEPGVTGCEIAKGGDCTAHTKDVFRGSNIRQPPYFCFVFQNISRPQQCNASFLYTLLRGSDA